MIIKPVDAELSSTLSNGLDRRVARLYANRSAHRERATPKKRHYRRFIKAAKERAYDNGDIASLIFRRMRSHAHAEPFRE